MPHSSSILAKSMRDILAWHLVCVLQLRDCVLTAWLTVLCSCMDVGLFALSDCVQCVTVCNVWLCAMCDCVHCALNAGRVDSVHCITVWTQCATVYCVHCMTVWTQCVTVDSVHCMTVWNDCVLCALHDCALTAWLFPLYGCMESMRD